MPSTPASLKQNCRGDLNTPPTHADNLSTVHKLKLGKYLFFLGTALFADSGSEIDPVHNVLMHIGLAILTSAVLAYFAFLTKQPVILAYLAAGALLGPNFGLGLVQREKDIATISEIGLILLLFMIGMEIDLKKIKASGKSLITSGVTQFAISVALGLGFFALLGYSLSGSKYDLFYLAVCCGISSTAIVVKLLYSKFELDTLSGRLTLGILVFQDIWAIIVLGVQPNLANPQILDILLTFAKAGALVAISVAMSKYVLPYAFSRIAKIPELVLLTSLGWCLAVCAAALALGLSLEMGALIAGVSISTFPYNLDVIAKITTMRDFFITIFFVSLGMKIPHPIENLSLVGMAFIVALFLIVARFLSIYPVLFSLKNGNRVSILTSLSLANMSEFSLVIAALGLASGHIDQNLLSIIIFTFVITSILAPYMIKYNHQIQLFLTHYLEKLGLRDKAKFEEPPASTLDKEIAILGFFRVASSLVLDIHREKNEDSLKDKIVVVDFNQAVHEKLREYGVPAVYGDIAHVDTLHHIGLHDTKIAVSTIPDNILVGTNNTKLVKQIQDIAPHAKIVVTAENPQSALKMYEAGADYVFLPRMLASQHLVPVLRDMLAAEDTNASSKSAKEAQKKAKARLEKLREAEIAHLKMRTEIIR
ncbi:MAG: Glutathione-regulated potassium-efflux system protein KefB [Turneriella sp.]|nr:Glutathione-regulated potassium-efflux system protein KefB [Turneriella sp.]